MAFRQDAAREHPQSGAVTEPQRRRKAIYGSTLPAARLLSACCVARRSQIHQGYALSSRLARGQNPQPQMSSHLRDRTLVIKNCDRCSHGPADRLPDLKSTAGSGPATGRWLQHLGTRPETVRRNTSQGDRTPDSTFVSNEGLRRASRVVVKNPANAK